MPVNLLSDCQEQAKAPDGKLKTVLRTSIERSEQYEECKSGKKSLSDWVREDYKQD